MDYFSTRQVAGLLGVSVSLLTKAVWCGRVDPPEKSPSGNFLWTPPTSSTARVLYSESHVQAGNSAAARRWHGAAQMKGLPHTPGMRRANNHGGRIPTLRGHR
jgi:hypothetical protein